MTNEQTRSASFSRRRFIGFAGLTLMFSSTVSVPAAAADPVMDAYRWDKRPLIVFVPDQTTSLLGEQRSALTKHSVELRDRDIVQIEVLGNDVLIDGASRPDVSATELRQRYATSRNTGQVLLVGKDGGIKIRQSHPISARQLFNTIDAMPMRRREMGAT